MATKAPATDTAAAAPKATKPAVDAAPSAAAGTEEDTAIVTYEENESLLDKLRKSLIRMVHPTGAKCDKYESDADGVHLVPADEAPELFAHGFEVAPADNG